MKDCIFCKIVCGEVPCEKVYEDEHTLAFLDIAPASKHHALVIPKKHYENMFDIPEPELLHVMKAVKKVVKLYENMYSMKHVNIVNNSGSEAKQVVFHLHFHIIPRGIK